MEFENVKEALKYMLELSNPGTMIIVKGRETTIDDYKEEYSEALYQLCDMLGMEDLYLSKPSKEDK